MNKELAIEEIIQNRMPWSKESEDAGLDPVLLLTREWLVTNGLGGYASASVSGACTRRYHGLLIASLPAPLGRMVMLSHLGEEMVLPDETIVDFGGEELNEEHLDLHSAQFLTEFRLEAGLPVWRFSIRGSVKRLSMPHLENTVHITILRVRQRDCASAPAALHAFPRHEAPCRCPCIGPTKSSQAGISMRSSPNHRYRHYVSGFMDRMRDLF
jgi:hypothetical protein